jgi:hypothetical protein
LAVLVSACTDSYVDSAHFQAVLSKLYGLATDSLQEDSWIEPYNQQFIDALRLQPAARLPGASLTDVCTHFREHYAVILDPKRMHEPDYWDTPEYQTTGPKYDWCLVVDDEALQSIDNGPEPIGPVSPEDAKSRKLSYKAHLVFVKLLCKSYTTMKRPHVLAASIRGSHDDHPDDCRCILWDGWLKFSPVMLLEVWDENNSGDIETYYKGPNQLLSIS